MDNDRYTCNNNDELCNDCGLTTICQIGPTGPANEVVTGFFSADTVSTGGLVVAPWDLFPIRSMSGITTTPAHLV